METIMKKIFTLLFIALLLATWGGMAIAKEKIVQLTIPGCSA